MTQAPMTIGDIEYFYYTKVNFSRKYLAVANVCINFATAYNHWR